MTASRSIHRHSAVALAVAALCALPPNAGRAADTDIYGPPASSASSPNVMFLLDNTSNWSANSQAWSKVSVDAKCQALPTASDRTVCLNYSSQIFGASASFPQGQIQLRALKLVLNELVCNSGADALKVNVGLTLMGQQSVLSNGHGVGIVNFAVQPLTLTVNASGTSSCAAMRARLDLIDAKIQNPDYKAPSSANYGAALYEIFKYFGGHSNPTLAGNPEPNGGSPVGASGYGPIRYSKSNVLDDVNAFTSADKTTYRSPLTAANSCGTNYVVLVGNTYPNAEPSNGGPTIFNGINYVPPALSAISSDTSRYADEWSYFLANTDVSDQPGVQRVFTYAINTYNAKPDADQGKLLKSMAAVGGVGQSGYLEIGGDLYALVNGFKKILSNIAAVNSVFSATTLPVSTTTQGTFLNQIFVGMFRPDAAAAPRWVGNLKQYQLALINGTLTLADKNNASAVHSSTGLFAATAQSFWVEPSVFFDQLPSGTPASNSDSPDGSIVEKGGVAQQIRKANLQGSSTRNVLTLSGSALASFTTATSGLTAAEVAWVRGENNVASGPGVESFNGSYTNAGTITQLGSTGVRHSVHGDVLHSRPVALNYGAQGVSVYYGANDGFLRAVDGNKTGTTAGQELWSFIAPEHLPLLSRLRAGTPKVQLPETDSSGSTLTPASGYAPRTYGMDGPIGVYALYSSATTVSRAIIYPTMRRGGRSVHAFDVSSRTAPVFLWKIVGGTTSGFSQLAQTWSMPRAVVMPATVAQAPFLIMGGGYDPAEDTNGSSGIGNRIYIINAETGALIKELSTDYSVPSDVNVVDVDGDGRPDRAYVADVRGNLYRVDFPTSGSILDSTSWQLTTAVKIASVGGKVFFAPDVVVTRDFVAVLVGTGDREKPLLNSTSDNFVLIKDMIGAPRAAPLTLSSLTRVAKIDNATMRPTQTVSAVNNAAGCYIELATNGEKVVNASFTIAGASYFGTNRPKPASSQSCSANLGEAYAYKFPLFCAAPQAPTPIIGGGLPPSAVGGIVTISVNGVDKQVPFLIGGTGPSNFDVSEPKPPIAPVRTRQTWRIDNNR